MQQQRSAVRRVLGVIVIVCGAATAWALWQEFETFEGLAYGPLNGKGGWTASSEVFVTNARQPRRLRVAGQQGPAVEL